MFMWNFENVFWDDSFSDVELGRATPQEFSFCKEDRAEEICEKLIELWG